MNEDKINIKLFSNPFYFPDEELHLIDLNLQMEAVDLKTDSFKKTSFFKLGPVQVMKYLFENCCQIHNFQIYKNLLKNVFAALEQRVSQIYPHLM